MDSCYNCIWFQEQVCMHEEAGSLYFDGAENTDYAEECEGFENKSEEENDC